MGVLVTGGGGLYRYPGRLSSPRAGREPVVVLEDLSTGFRRLVPDPAGFAQMPVRKTAATLRGPELVMLELRKAEDLSQLPSWLGVGRQGRRTAPRCDTALVSINEVHDATQHALVKAGVRAFDSAAWHSCYSHLTALSMIAAHIVRTIEMASMSS